MRAKFLNKIGYGMDQSGEEMDQHGVVNIEDTAAESDYHTPGNMANMIRDTSAEKQFPELHPKPNRLPTRSAK